MNSIRSSHRHLLATVALCLIAMPASVIVPTTPAAAQDHATALKDIERRMAALRGQIAQFTIPADYCGPRQAMRGRHAKRMADYSARAQALIDDGASASEQLSDSLRRRSGATGRRALEDGQIADPTAYIRERNALIKAVEDKQLEYDTAAAKRCGGTGGGSGSKTFVSTGPSGQQPPKPPQPPAPPPIPEITPPTYQPVDPFDDLPDRYCSVKERVDLQLALEAEQIKAHENTKLAGMFRTSVMWAIFHLEQDKRPVPPYLRALEARAIAERAQWEAVFDAIQQLRGQAGGIPLIDCLAAIEKLRTGQAGTSGTEVQPGFPTQRDPSQDVRGDVEQRVREAETGQEKHQRPAGPDRAETEWPRQDAVSLQPLQPESEINKRDGIGDPFDPGNVEVLKGPQGPQFGSDPGGGTVRLVPRKPPSAIDPPPPPSRPGYLDVDPPQVAGTWRLANPASGVSTVTISGSLMLTGMGPAIQLQRDGNAYFGEGAVLFGKGGHSIRLIDRGNGTIDVSAENGTGGRFFTTMSRG